MTDEKGTVKYTYAYNPYGELTKGSYGQVMFLFNGQYGVASDDNGLYYMRARYYNVSIKRFINQDVVTGSIAESQSLNRYAYVEGNPVSYFDPFGLEKVDTSGIHSVLSVIGIAAFIAAIVYLSGGTAVPAYVFVISLGSGMGQYLTYSYDYSHASNEEEKIKALQGMTWAGLGVTISGSDTGSLLYSAADTGYSLGSSLYEAYKESSNKK